MSNFATRDFSGGGLDFKAAVTNSGAPDFGSGDKGGDASAATAVDETANAERLAALEQERQAAAAKARDAGWAPQVPYNYTENTNPAGEIGEAPDAAAPAAPWLADAVIYEWCDEYGEVGPRNEELERELFQAEHRMRSGGAIQALTFDVSVEGPEASRPAPVREFDDAGLHPVMRENVRLCGYVAPTVIQAYCIPAVLMGHDVVACAQTGSGKTGAYLIPILSRLMGKAKALAAPRPNPKGYNRMTDRVRAEPLVLIVCPTRELACQIFDDCRRLCYRTQLRPCVIYGGAPTRTQRESLEMGCDVLIATPGRLMDFMQQQNLVAFHRLKFTVIDEADELLSNGWEECMEKIFSGADVNVDADHTYLMFSATFPKEARKLAKEYMEDDFVKIRVGRVGSTHANIKQTIVWVDDSSKNQALFDLVFNSEPCRTLIFVNAKRKAEMVDDFLYNKGLPSTSIHSDRTQREREDALRAFKMAKCPILVATGVTARGLDVSGVGHVINYDMPSTAYGGITEYVHRIGRTGRIGNVGRATSFYNEGNEEIADALVKLLVENKQEVPDFLQDRIPETLDFDEDKTDNEDDDGGFGAAGFGAGDDAGSSEGDVNGSEAGGFKADNDDENKMASW
ncbi:DEAD-domain-containing protein [Delitschia confertaspora ATCC 74209]|uniref:RNA helicase n=1 Tax=Delitschia confertaspora ATCC 74209 TaxID=1513339 RepID=A0A9P4JGG0_9PLEO|nr:DEAD-domain-containing protein [Delitschia confertaspora ATCC 74209]